MHSGRKPATPSIVSAALAALAPSAAAISANKKELYESSSATDFTNKGDELRESAAVQLNSANETRETLEHESSLHNPSAAAMAIIKETPNIFDRLAALNARLEAQTERLEEVSRPSTSSLFQRAAAVGVAFRRSCDGRSKDTSVVESEVSSSSGYDSNANVGAGSEEPIVSVAARARPQRPSTAPPSAAPASRLIRALMSANSEPTPKAEWQDTEEYRSWTHNTNYFRDGRRLWLELVADIALFGAARSAVLRSRSGDSRRPPTQHEEPPSFRVWSCGCSSGEELYSCRMTYERWVKPTFQEVFHTAVPVFHGLGTDRSAAILDVARSESTEWSEAALANVPPEMLREYFLELPEPVAEREQRQREAMMSGFTTLPKRRFTLPSASLRRCDWRVEDTGGDCDHTTDAEWALKVASSSSGPLYDLILCRYSIFLYATSEQTARRALGRLVSKLSPEGILLLGTTDALPQCAHLLLEPVPVDDVLTAAAAARRSHGACRGPTTKRVQPLGLASPDKRPLLANAWRLKHSARRHESAAAGAPFTLDQAAAHTTTPLTPDSHFAALRASTSLQHFRSLLGLKPQFAEPQARNTNPSYMSERSNSILKTKGAFFDIPITDRVAEYERQRQKKLAALRAEKDAAEMAEVTRAHAALRAKLRARSSTPQQPPGSDAPNSWMSGPLGLQPNTGRPSTVPNLHSRAVVRQTRMGIALSGSPYGQCTTRHEAAASLYKLATTTTTPARVRSGRRPGRVKRTKMTSY